MSPEEKRLLKEYMDVFDSFPTSIRKAITNHNIDVTQHEIELDLYIHNISPDEIVKNIKMGKYD